MKQVVGTSGAPKAIGTYSQAIKSGSTVYFSGQIPLDPETMEIVVGDFKARVKRVFDNRNFILRCTVILCRTFRIWFV